MLDNEANIGVQNSSPFSIESSYSYEVSEDEELSNDLVSKVTSVLVADGFYLDYDETPDIEFGKGRYYQVALKTRSGITYEVGYGAFYDAQKLTEKFQLDVNSVDVPNNFLVPSLIFSKVNRGADLESKGFPGVENTKIFKRFIELGDSESTIELSFDERTKFLKELINSKVDSERTIELFKMYKDDWRCKWAKTDIDPSAFFKIKVQNIYNQTS